MIFPQPLMNVISNAEYTNAHGKVHLKSTLQNHADVLQCTVWPLYKKNVSGHIKVQTYQVLWP